MAVADFSAERFATYSVPTLARESMDGHIKVYEHALITARATRALCALVTAFAVVIGLWAVPAHAADGLVTGTVTDAGGDPLPNVGVQVFWLHNTSSPHFDPVGYDETDAGGNFAVDAPPGTVRVLFLGDPDHSGEWYDDVAAFEDATDLTLANGDSVTADAELAEYGRLDGHVERQAGDPSARSVALLDPVTGAVRERTAVSGSGDYSFTAVTPGSYKVSFNRLSGFAFSAAQFWEATAEHAGLGAADIVTVDAAEVVSGVDATLVEGGHITGALRDGSGNPLACKVQAFTSDRALVTRSVVSGVDGTFDISGLSTGNYLVRVVPSGGCHAGVQYRQDGGGVLTRVRAEADAVPVALGGTSSAGTALVYQVPPQPVVTNTGAPSVFVWPVPGTPVGGPPMVGSQLQAAVGGWFPSPTSYAYAWLADGVPIPGATASGYVPVAADVGKLIAVRIQASRSGYQTGTAFSAAVGPVSGPPISNIAPPNIATSPQVQVGRWTRAYAGAWSVPDTGYIYTWMCGSKVLQTSDQPRFLVPAIALTQGLTVTVTASKPGFVAGTATSAVRQVLVGIFRVRKPVLVKGDARVGSVLKASGKLSPKPTHADYVWKRDGQTIVSVKGPTYRPTAADIGHRISVRVKYSGPGFKTKFVESPATAVIRR